MRSKHRNESTTHGKRSALIRNRGDVPDEKITRQILRQFGDGAAFEAWVVDIGSTLDPSKIRGRGYGVYLSDAQRWTTGGRSRAPTQRTTQSTLHPETARRIREAREPKFWTPDWKGNHEKDDSQG